MIEFGATCPSAGGRDASPFPIRWYGVGIGAGPWSGPTPAPWTHGAVRDENVDIASRRRGLRCVLYHELVVRSLHLETWAGLWVAVDRDGQVVANAESVGDLLRDLRRNEVEGVEIMRAPDPREPAAFGLG